MKSISNFLHKTSVRTFFSLLSILTFFCFSSSLAMAEDVGHGDHKMDHGSMDHGGSVSPGDEYRVDPPAGHDAHGGHGEEGTSIYRTRGAHDENAIQKPKEGAEGLLARGRNIYLHMCVFCHGQNGNAGGAAVEYLYPWPRDFTLGIFKFRSTPTESLPKDEDLYRTIIRGVPGTSMPAWGDALSPEDTWALVNLIKSFSDRFKKEKPAESVKISEPPAPTPELLAKGQSLFTNLKCVQCHGKSLRGDGKLADSLMDAWKHAVFVHDLTTPAYFKSGNQPKDIFRTLSTGLDGTPMESYAHIPAQDRWALVHYIRSKFSKKMKKAEFETDVYSYKVGVELNTDVASPVWKGVEFTELILRPLSPTRLGLPQLTS